MKFSTRNITFRQAVAGFIGAIAISATMIMPAVAADSVTQVITSAGSLTASVANASMTSIQYSNTAGSTSGTLVLSVSDPRGTSVGWSVSIQSSDFMWGGGVNANAHNIPASGFAITTVNTPVMTAGQAVDATGGPRALSAAAATLDQARTPIAANLGFGSGNYTQSLPVSLVIPALSQTGTYTATLTVLTAAAP
jgi:hypothetical protein